MTIWMWKTKRWSCDIWALCSVAPSCSTNFTPYPLHRTLPLHRRMRLGTAGIRKQDRSCWTRPQWIPFLGRKIVKKHTKAWETCLRRHEPATIENNLPSMPSPVYQWRKALRRNITENCSATRFHVSWTAVVLPTNVVAILRPLGGMSQMDALTLFGIHSTK